DGIRDPLVTGVQTCALPISALVDDLLLSPRALPQASNEAAPLAQNTFSPRCCSSERQRSKTPLGHRLESLRSVKWPVAARAGKEIGRASCRERGEGRGCA